MAFFNLVVLQGNLTREPELRYTPKGTASCQFTLAVNRVWTDDAGTKKEEVSFFDCQAWGRTAEVIAQYVKKGHSLLVEGKLKQDTWDDKQSGEKRSKVKVNVDSMVLQNNNRGDGQQLHAPDNRRQAQPPSAQPSPKYESQTMMMCLFDI